MGHLPWDPAAFQFLAWRVQYSLNTTSANCNTYLCLPAHSSVVSPEGHYLFLPLHIVQVAKGFP